MDKWVNEKIESELKVIGKQFPSFSLTSLDNILVNNDSLVGKVGVINFMYIGCPPCMTEISYLNGLQNDYKDKDVKLICFAPHTPKMLSLFTGIEKDNSQLTIAFEQLKKMFRVPKIEYPIIPACIIGREARIEGENIRLGPDCTYITDHFFVNSYPQTFIVDKKGVVRKVIYGFSNDGNIIEYKKSIDELLEE